MTIQKYHEILDYLHRLTAGTRWDGHLYAVGGCVRDEYMGGDINDVDIAVDLPGGGVDFARWLLSRRKTLGVPVFFRKFGTARLRLRRFPEEEIELVQTRAEKYTDRTSRCPEVVSGDIREDCFRRDFTVNTLYRNVSTGEILDLTGKAFHDIREGIIRTPMDPYETFDDDPVRILRCLRFAARFGWKVEESVMEALCRSVGRLSIVSRERWAAEFTKMLLGRNVRKSLGTLKDIGGLRLMNQTMREMSALRPWPDSPTLLDTAIDDVARLEEEGITDPAARFAAFFGNLGMLRAGVRDRTGELRYPRHENTGGFMAAGELRRMGVAPEIAVMVRDIIQRRGDDRMRAERLARQEKAKARQKEQQEEKSRRRRERQKRHQALLAEQAGKKRSRRRSGSVQRNSEESADCSASAQSAGVSRSAERDEGIS